MPILEGCCVDLLGEGDGGVCETIYTVSVSIRGRPHYY